MEKKRSGKGLEDEDIKGFEEFIEGQNSETNFLPRGVGGATKKNETGFEHFTFLSNDSARLMKLRDLLKEKLPFSAKFEQGQKLVQDQKKDIENLKKKLFMACDKPDSAYKKSIKEIFDSFFGPTKS